MSSIDTTPSDRLWAACPTERLGLDLERNTSAGKVRDPLLTVHLLAGRGSLACNDLPSTKLNSFQHVCLPGPSKNHPEQMFCPNPTVPFIPFQNLILSGLPVHWLGGFRPRLTAPANLFSVLAPSQLAGPAVWEEQPAPAQSPSRCLRAVPLPQSAASTSLAASPPSSHPSPFPENLNIWI